VDAAGVVAAIEADEGIAGPGPAATVAATSGGDEDKLAFVRRKDPAVLLAELGEDLSLAARGSVGDPLCSARRLPPIS
jgi:hypothetical protein